MTTESIKEVLNWPEPIYKLPRTTIDKLADYIVKINALVEIAACHNFHLNSKETMELFFSALLDYSQQATEICDALMKERCLCPNFKK